MSCDSRVSMPRDSDGPSRAGNTTARNIQTGRDFTQINNSITHPTHPKQPSSRHEVYATDSWLQFFTFLLKPSAITIPRLNTVFRAGFLGSIAVILGTLTTVLPNYTLIFSDGYSLAPSVYFPIILSAFLVAYISKEYFLTRESTTCPSCDSPFSLLPKSPKERPIASTTSHLTETRTIECTQCEYELTDHPAMHSHPNTATSTPRPSSATAAHRLRKESHTPPPIT